MRRKKYGRSIFYHQTVQGHTRCICCRKAAATVRVLRRMGNHQIWIHFPARMATSHRQGWHFVASRLSPEKMFLEARKGFLVKVQSQGRQRWQLQANPRTPHHRSKYPDSNRVTITYIMFLLLPFLGNYCNAHTCLKGVW